MRVLQEIAPVNLPDTWSLRRIRDIAILINGFPFKSEDFDISGDVPLVRIRDLFSHQFEVYVPKISVPDEALIRDGDIAVGMDGDFNSTIWNRGPAALNQRICVLRPKKGTDHRFLSYVLPPILRVLNDLTYSTTVKHLSGQDVLQQVVPFPPIEMQNQVSSFLDRETMQIDRLIAKQERLIELIAEKRQAIITQAVTKGLDPSAPTKPSGIPWVGQVPADWSLPKLKQCCRLKRGRFMHRPRNAAHLYGGKYPFIQTGSIARAEGKYITKYSQTLSEAGMETSTSLPQGCLVMAIAANIGDVAILGFDSCAPDSVVGFHPTQHVSSDFLYYALASRRNELVREAPVTSQGNLNLERVGSLTIPLPSIREQRAIVCVLDRELERIQQLKNLADKAILLLKERRSALISAAVTGEIDIRKGAA